MKKITKAKTKAKPVEEVKEDLFEGVRAKDAGYEAVCGGVAEFYEGNEAFSIAAKRYKVLRGF